MASIESVLEEMVKRISRLENQSEKLNRSEGPRGIFCHRPTEVQLYSNMLEYNRGHTHYRIRSQTGLSDNLDSITNGTDGVVIILSAVDGHDITVTQTGNIEQPSSPGSFHLDDGQDRMMLMYDEEEAKWCELSRSDNA